MTKTTNNCVPISVIEILKYPQPSDMETVGWTGKIPLNTYLDIQQLQISLQRTYGDKFPLSNLIPYLLSKGLDNHNLIP